MRRTCLTLVGLLGCRDRPEPPPPPPPPAHDGVTLIQPGVAPLQPLRYHLARGQTIQSRLVSDVDVKSRELAGPMPSQVVDLETVVEDVLGDGAAKLRITVQAASVLDRPGGEVSSEVTRAQTEALRGVVITEVLAPDGKISDAHVEAGAAPDKLHRELDGLLQGLQRVAARLPAEPVGVGATWRERRTLPEGGIHAISEITYTLLSVSGTTIAYTSAGQASGAPETVEQDGAKIQVTDTHGHSEASGTIDLARYAQTVTAASSFTTTMAMIAPEAGSSAPGTERSTIEIAMRIRMTSAQGAHSAP